MADPLEKIYDRFKAAEEIAVYKKSDAAFKILSEVEFDAQSQEFRDIYSNNYDTYTATTKNQINLTKDAMKVKLAELKAALNNNTNFDSVEKVQYCAEIDNAISTIKPVQAKAF